MDRRRPQLSLDELQQLKWLLGGVLTLLALSTVFYMDVEAWTIMTLTTVATLVTLWRPTLPSRLPSLVHTLAFPAIVAFFAGDLWLRSEVLPAMVRLDMLLLLYRNVSYRQRRDDLQVIVLGLFLIIVAGVLTVSLVFAAQLLVYTACALAFLFTITLSDGGRKPEERGQKAGPPTWAVHCDWRGFFRRLREVADWRVIWLGVGLFAGVVGVSALLFLAIPRFQLDNGMFLDRFITKKAKTGFSESVRFGDVTDILQDTSIAMSVDISDPTLIPATPYWRMLVLDDYRDGTFRLSPVMKRVAFGAERTYNRFAGTARLQRGPAVHWTFYLESGVSRFLPLIGRFQQLTFVEAQNFTFSPSLNIVMLRQEPVTMTAYRAEGLDTSGVLPDENFALTWQRRAETLPRIPLQSRVPGGADFAALQRVVNEITGGERRSAADFAARAGAWLRSHHGYSLSPRIPAGENEALVRWLTSREAGHCELFAGSFVLLARTAGFPARLVTGFKGGSWNTYSGNFTIRNSDAHAWAEIFDPEEQGGAWLRTDPLEAPNASQADTRGEAALARRADRSWSARFDSLRVFWYRRIVSFDQRSQAETLKSLKEAMQGSGKRLRADLAARIEEVRAWLAAPWSGGRLAKVGTVIGVVVGTLWLLREFGATWWRGLFRGRGAPPEDPVRREAGRWLGRLRRDRGDTTWVIAETQRVEDDLLRLRYGARPTWPEPEKVFRRARRALRDEHRKRLELAP